MTDYYESLEQFVRDLEGQERSENTIKKYRRDVRHFLVFLKDASLEKETILRYKASLQEQYKISSANSMLVAVNGFLRFIGHPECCVQTFRMQRQIFRPEERNLNRKEYERLVAAARKQGRKRIFYILQTIACTGIRIGELKYITVEAVKEGKVCVNLKGKTRVILLPRSLALLLREYCRHQNIHKGQIFVTSKGKPVCRQGVWAEMKEISMLAGIQTSKVFPHNLRHLFAKCFYEREKDVVRLADYLGHSSIETTRRYTMISSREACERQLELGLLIMN